MSAHERKSHRYLAQEKLEAEELHKDLDKELCCISTDVLEATSWYYKKKNP